MSSLSAPAPGARRERLGPYELRDVLGGGGMGVVYRGVAPDGRPVAVKTLRAHLSRPSDVRRFEREASIRIDHPNVIEVLDSGVADDGTPYIVFELLEGESLEERLDRGPLPPLEAVPLVIQTCRALAAVHAAGVVHRDLKPANLFRCHDGRLKLLDFGIARVGGAKMTAEGTVVGTLSYLSPEQARGSPHVDARTDVWATGAVMFEMLSGTAPFDRPSPVATLLAILNEEPPRLEHLTGTPPDLAEVVARCLRKDPLERWNDVDALAEALDALSDLDGGTMADARPVVRSRDSFAETMAASGTRPSIRPDEQRIVAVLLARDVSDMAAVESAITARGGRFFALLGKDAIGLFGAERLEGDETHRAIRAGLDCRLATRSMAVGSGRIRSSGVGLAGEALRQAEIASEAELVGVAVPASIARAAMETFNVREADGDLSEIVGERPAGASVASADSAELVGREVELAQIRAMAGIALDGRRATLVLLVGPPGIGKSRLRREVAGELAASHEPRALLGLPDSAHRSTAFATWATILRRRADAASRDEGWPRLDPGAPPTERGMAVRMLAREALPAREANRCADFLGELLGVEVQKSVELEAARQDPRLMSDRVRLALLDYVCGLVSQGPTVIMIEDLEWSDAASIQLLVEVLERSKDAPLFVLGAARDDVSLPEELDRQALLRLRLAGLGEGAVRAMAERIAGRPLSTHVLRALAARAEGNPLFVEQVVLDLRDAGMLDGEASELPVPLSVEAAVQSRLDRLEEPDRGLCKLLSLFDRPAHASELEGLGASEPAARLASLVARELLEAGRSGEATVYGFRSPLMAEVAYRTIVPELRMELHARLGRALSRRGADPEEAARHLERGGLSEEAARQYAEAVVSASRRGDSESVLRCSRAALGLGLTDQRIRFDIHMSRADALRFRGDREAQAEELESALTLADTEAQRARVLIEQAVGLTRRGRVAEAIERAEEARVHAERSGDDEARALVLGRLGEARTQAGSYEAAEADLEAAARLARSPRTCAMIAEWRALLAAGRGDIGAAWEHFAEAVERFEEAGDERRAAANLGNLADAYNRLGDHVEATAALERALEGCRRVGNRTFEGYVQLNLAYARMSGGDPGAALRAVDEAEALAVQTRSKRIATVASVYRARCLRALERVDEAERCAARVLADLEGGPASTWAAAARVILGRIALERGALDGALEHSAAALALRDELGGLEEDEADVFLLRADALAAAGRPDEAEAVRRRGCQRLLEVASRVADEGWRKRFLERPAAHRALLESAS